MAADPYQTLGVTKDASQDAIQKAYRRLAKKLHPDLNPRNKQAEEQFKEVSAAYDLLGDPEKRARFDRGEIDASGDYHQLLRQVIELYMMKPTNGEKITQCDFPLFSGLQFQGLGFDRGLTIHLQAKRPIVGITSDITSLSGKLKIGVAIHVDANVLKLNTRS